MIRNEYCFIGFEIKVSGGIFRNNSAVAKSGN
jgi:hypothetical protein